MIQASRQQKFRRWDTLPGILREALFSEAISSTVWSSCAAEHLSEEKSGQVAHVVSMVLMGFLHPEDVAKEIQDEAQIDKNIAESLAATFDTKIFTPYRIELDKIYAPPSAYEEEGLTTPIVDIAAPTKNGPAPLSVEMPGEKFGAKVPQPLTQTTTMSAAPATPFTIPVAPKATTAPKPIGSISPSTPPAPLPKVAPPMPFLPQKKESPMVPSVGTVPTPMPAPLIMSEEAKSVPTMKAGVAFKLEISPESSASKNPQEIKPFAPPPKPARLEIGIMPTDKKVAETAKTPVSQMRIVHYTDMRTPLETPPTTNLPPAAPTKPSAPALPNLELKDSLINKPFVPPVKTSIPPPVSPLTAKQNLPAQELPVKSAAPNVQPAHPPSPVRPTFSFPTVSQPIGPQSTEKPKEGETKSSPNPEPTKDKEPPSMLDLGSLKKL
jgi:hypothetical protein